MLLLSLPVESAVQMTKAGATDEQADQRVKTPGRLTLGERQHSVILYDPPGQTPSSGSAVSGPGLSDELINLDVGPVRRASCRWRTSHRRVTSHTVCRHFTLNASPHAFNFSLPFSFSRPHLSLSLLQAHCVQQLSSLSITLSHPSFLLLCKRSVSSLQTASS